MDSLTIASGYELALFLQTGAGYGVSCKDSLGNEFTLKTSGSYNSSNSVLGIVQLNTGTELNDQVVGDFNQGSEAFGVTKSGAVSWCNV